jgi:hypothetical protein
MVGANRWFVGLDSIQKICHFLKMPNKNKLVHFPHNWNDGTMEYWNIGFFISH